MFKKRNHIFLLLTALIMSCSSFLDEVPDNRVALDNLDKAAQLLTSAYSVASPAFTDWMTDDVDWILGTRIRPSHEQIFKWEDVTTGGPTIEDTPDYFWYETYQAIAHANEVLAVVENLSINTDEEEAKQRAVKSEALLARAYGHFMLASLFAPDFRRSQSAKAIPYVKTPETTFIEVYERRSVRRVYDDIEDDLLEGLSLVDESFFANSGKYHFNRNAALAFASRFYLFIGNYSKCLEYSDELLGANPEAFVRDLSSDDFQNARSSLVLYPQTYSSPDQQSNLLLMRKLSLVQRTDFSFGPTINLYRGIFNSNPFEGTVDQRSDPALVKGQNGTFPSRYESLFERLSLNSNVGTPYHIAIVFRGEEVLLNRVEANIFLGQLDAAIADLQVLSERRYTGAPFTLTLAFIRGLFGATDDPNFSDGDVMLNYLLLERRKEFIGQGMRWFDIKRYNIAVTHSLPLENREITLERDDLRKILQIPSSAVALSGLEPNPR